MKRTDLASRLIVVRCGYRLWGIGCSYGVSVISIIVRWSVAKRKGGTRRSVQVSARKPLFYVR